MNQAGLRIRSSVGKLFELRLSLSFPLFSLTQKVLHFAFLSFIPLFPSLFPLSLLPSYLSFFLPSFLFFPPSLFPSFLVSSLSSLFPPFLPYFLPFFLIYFLSSLFPPFLPSFLLSSFLLSSFLISLLPLIFLTAVKKEPLISALTTALTISPYVLKKLRSHL